jgi:hypothetical protein
MTSKKSAANKSAPNWSDVKAALNDMDRAGLLALLQNLYAANADNRTFLHTRFALGADTLAPYKTVIDRWLSPNFSRNEDFSVAKAKKAIADYRKAIGNAGALVELMVYYCERATRFSDEYGLQDEGYFDALVRMFEQALKAIATLPKTQQLKPLARLDQVRKISRNFGYGVNDDMGDLLARFKG